MAKTGPGIATPEKVEIPPETVSITFREEKKVPKDFENFDIDDEVRIVITGKIYATNRSKRGKKNDFNDAARIEVTQDKVKIQLLREEPASMEDAMNKAEEKRRM